MAESRILETQPGFNRPSRFPSGDCTLAVLLSNGGRQSNRNPPGINPAICFRGSSKTLLGLSSKMAQEVGVEPTFATPITLKRLEDAFGYTCV
jgi:hypothetical protein